MREKLIELLGSKVCDGYSPTCDEWKPHSCEKCFANNCRIGELADYLLQNGVVVKEHGKWDRSGYCSNCNYWTCYCGDFNYCPNCGARMDGDEE